MAKPVPEFIRYLEDSLQHMGPVVAKRMFGGFGFFLNGLMFAIVADETLYLKADSETIPNFTELGLEPFTYHKQGNPFNLSYYQAPEDTLEDVALLNEWSNEAYAVALRAAEQKARKSRRKS